MKNLSEWFLLVWVTPAAISLFWALDYLTKENWQKLIPFIVYLIVTIFYLEFKAWKKFSWEKRKPHK